MNIFDPVVLSSRAATAPASPNSWSGNCKATCRYKPWSQEQPLLHPLPLPGKPSRSPYLTCKGPPPRGTTPPAQPPPPQNHPKIPIFWATHAEVSHPSLTCPHPLTPQVPDKSSNSLQLVHAVQVLRRSEQPRGARLSLQRCLSGAAERRLHEAPLGWREAAGTSLGQLQVPRPQKQPSISQSFSESGRTGKSGQSPRTIPPRLQTSASPLHHNAKACGGLLPGF